MTYSCVWLLHRKEHFNNTPAGRGTGITNTRLGLTVAVSYCQCIHHSPSQLQVCGFQAHTLVDVDTNSLAGLAPSTGDELRARPVSSENKARGTRDKYTAAHCVSFRPITASSSPLVTGWVLRFSAAFKARSWRTSGLYDPQRNSDGLKLTIRYCPRLSREPATCSVLRHKTHGKEQQTREGKLVEKKCE